jgi:ribosomal protein S4
MRKYNKFKFVSRFYIYPYCFHKRILHFKRPKWIAAQKKILNLENQIKNLHSSISSKKKFLKFNKSKEIKNNILKNFYFNFITIKSKVNSWQRLRFFYKETLLMKNVVRKYFDGQFSLTYFKRLFKKPRTRCFTLASVFIRPEFRLDILLWRLKIFSSVFLAKIAIRNKQITVNGLNKNFDFYLTKGDIIKFSLIKTYTLKKYFLKYFKIIFIPSFIELDFYTNTIIVLKSFNNFKIEDFSSVIKEPLCLHKFKNYMLK